jgi:hypothetical protein
MDRYWLLTNTCYGTRLPGNARGFVGRVWEHRPSDPTGVPRIAHNLPDTPCDEDMPGLERASRDRLKGPPITLARPQAEILLAQSASEGTPSPAKSWAISRVGGRGP